MVVTGHGILTEIAVEEERLSSEKSSGERMGLLRRLLNEYESTVLVRVGGQQVTIREALSERGRTQTLLSRARLTNATDRLTLRRRVAEIDAAVADGRTVRLDLDGAEDLAPRSK